MVYDRNGTSSSFNIYHNETMSNLARILRIYNVHMFKPSLRLNEARH